MENIKPSGNDSIINSKSGDTTSLDKAGSIKIPVFAESVIIEKKVVESGKVLVHKIVEERNEVITTDLRRDEVVMNRVARNELVNGPIPQTRYEGDVMVIPILREEYVLVKQVTLVEEIHIEKRSSTEQVSQSVSLREEKVTIERKEIV